MPTPSDEIVKIMAVFASAMTAPTYAKAVTLVIGTILTPGCRTVCAVLRVLGLDSLKRAPITTGDFCLRLARVEESLRN